MAGCPGNGTDDQCLSSKRAHFRPAKLPAAVKAYIYKRFGGLSAGFADL
ncbi:hypothetical protein PR003_g2426 [Phytophthora rubi]|uniref:Uncharacterized protein n=1 Tax=Phytophthora rubi TaxID=129364 RepID=A0A6A4G3M7_9STRA|nr:hypothetical protein PR002_g11150 [Phytophthora rubi]KAE9356230.1 hypothetical protein PR003_g2426 [Phytophthora rubi]